jgi:hypothetical protein
LVAAFDDVVLMRHVWGSEVPLYTGLLAVLVERREGDLAATVSAQNLQLVSALHLGSCLYLDDGTSRLVLGCEKLHPHVATSSSRLRRDRSAQITVDELERPPHPILSLLRERCAALLSCEARVAEVVGMIYVRETTHESVAKHPLHLIEVQVPEPRMPAPGLAHVTYGEAHWANRG